MNIEHRVAPAVARAGDADRLVSAWCCAWNEPDPERRLRRLQKIWCDDSTFENLAAHVRGSIAMNAHIASWGTGHAGWRFRVADVVAFGGHLDVSWELLDATGHRRLGGHDVAERRDDGRLQRVVSFWLRRVTG